jgi:hypothetical protein
VDGDLLRSFAAVLSSGDSSLTDRQSVRSVIMLRDLLLTAPNEMKATRRAVYLKAVRALRAFVDGEVLGKLYAATAEMFDLPESAQAVEVA